ncbi:MAG: pseudouridine synthase [Patescibacteria group bacterium]
MLQRINKYLASLGVASRRKIDELIEKKKVLINHQVARLGDKVDDYQDTVQVGKKIYPPTSAPKHFEYWLVYKPVGYVSSTHDPEGKPVVTSLVETKQRVYPVGRLDVDSEGLIILTNDGKFTNRLTHPSHHLPKIYHVSVVGKISSNGLLQIRKGIKMKRGKFSPAEIRVLDKDDGIAILEITLYQGLNRQIRRMMKAINLEVKKLVRVAVGGLVLGKLKPGEARLLTKQEIDKIFLESKA